MTQIFFHCEKLSSIDVSKFKTSNVTSMENLFAYCYQLTSINLTNFDTSKVINMKGIFSNLYNLKYLDISNFNTSLVNDTSLFCKQCMSLIFLNINSFIFTNKTKINDAFKDINNNTKICLNDNSTKVLLFGDNKISECSDICFQKDIKIDLSQNICVNYCKMKIFMNIIIFVIKNAQMILLNHIIIYV